MIFPRIEFDVQKIKENAEYIKELCDKNGIQVMAVTKGYCGYPPVVKELYNAGIRNFGDSRIKNIKRMREAGIKGEMTLIRIPMISEAEEVIRCADVSLNSEIKVLQALDNAAKQQDKAHKVILMVDVGDLREGVQPDDLEDFVSEALIFKNLKIIGLGFNVGCFGGVLPTEENTQLLVDLAQNIQDKFDIKLDILSGGSTCALPLVEKNELPQGINQFRIGEAIIVGRDSTGNRCVPGTRQDTIKLVAEVIELKRKPSMPIGEIGKDAFGNTPVFEDKGIRLRAILAIGRQDADPEKLIPLTDGVEILGGSSDHLLIDVTDSDDEFFVGKEVTFGLTYGAMLRLMTSEYVKKIVI